MSLLVALAFTGVLVQSPVASDGAVVSGRCHGRDTRDGDAEIGACRPHDLAE